MDTLKLKLNQILNHYEPLLTSTELIDTVLKRIHQLKLRIESHLILSSSRENDNEQVRHTKANLC